MSTALDIAVIALGVNGLATTGALVYVVRRVTPWPKPPAPAQPRRPGQGTGTAGGSGQADGQAPAANGADPVRSAAT